jgi:hypothetical protein
MPGISGRALIGSSHSLYLIGEGNSMTITRVDPATGAARAHASYGAAGNLTPGTGVPVLAGRGLWTVTAIGAGGAVTLKEFDATTLAAIATLHLQFPDVVGGNESPALAAAPDGKTVYVGAGTSVAWVDAATAHVIRRVPIAGGQVGGLAVAPDGSRLFIGITADNFYADGGGDPSILQALDPTSGALIKSAGGVCHVGHRCLELGGIEGLVASSGGVWVANEGGPHSEFVGFLPADLDATAVGELAGGTGGGGETAFASLGGGLVWVGGGPDGLSCGDPVSGGSRGDLDLPSTPLIEDGADAGSRVFALVGNGGALSVYRLTPPPNCTR